MEAGGTAMAGLTDQVRFALLKRNRRNPVYATNCKASNVNKESASKFEKIIRHLLPGYRMLDFASGTTYEELKFITEHYLESKKNEDIPIVAISHPKNFGISKEFEDYLKWIDSSSVVEFETTTDKFFWR